MKILITGGSGLLGTNFILTASEMKNHNVFALYNEHPLKDGFCNSFKADILDKPKLKKLFSEINPDVVVHSAAITDVNYCESHKEEAYKVNVDGTKNVLDASYQAGSKSVYISSDSLFDGRRGNYSEEDIPNPVNYYGKTKLFGEKEAEKYNSLIVRTNFYGWNAGIKKEFSEWIVKSLEAGSKVNLFTDVYFNPIIVTSLSRIIVELAEKNKKGVFNVAGREVCSRFQFGNDIAEVFGLDKSLIIPTKFSENKSMATRPLNPTLDVSKVSKTLKEDMPNIKDGVAEMKRLRDSGYLKKLKSMF